MTGEQTKLIVGLGNPGLIYAGSRHNIGFTVLKTLTSSLKISFKRDRLAAALVAKDELFGQQVIMALPQKFMNLSGIPVKALLKKFPVDPKNILVVCDDLDLELGKIKLRPQGSSGGQRGLDSIIQHLGSQDFCRLRIGIGRPKNSAHAAAYVLSGFSRNEKAVMEQAKQDAVSCIMSWVEIGTEKTMNIYNVGAPRA